MSQISGAGALSGPRLTWISPFSQQGQGRGLVITPTLNRKHHQDADEDKKAWDKEAHGVEENATHLDTPPHPIQPQRPNAADAQW